MTIILLILWSNSLKVLNGFFKKVILQEMNALTKSKIETFQSIGYLINFFSKALFVKYVAYDRKKSAFGFFIALLQELFIEKKIY